MKIMQVFDCTDIEDSATLTRFYDMGREYGNGLSNESYLKVDLTAYKEYLNGTLEPEWKYEFLEEESKNFQVYQWLIDNGATDNEVLVAYWW